MYQIVKYNGSTVHIILAPKIFSRIIMKEGENHKLHLEILKYIVIYIITSEVPVEHETLKSGRDVTGRDGTWRDATGRRTDDDDAGRTDVKVEIFM